LLVVVEEKKEQNLASIMSAKSKIKREIQLLSDQLKASKDEISNLKRKIAVVEGNTCLSFSAEVTF
jgi:hypothetical protein